MPVHKFGRKPERLNQRRQPLSIHWSPKMDVDHLPIKVTPVTWEINAQEDLKITRNGVKTVMLGFGFIMSRGMILTSLKQELKYKKCSLQNEVILDSEVNDIIITIQNNSNKDVTIEKGSPLCFVHYMQ